jgi:hypothetical protein
VVDEVHASLRRVREAFSRYPRRPMLDGCPHCRGAVTVAEHDLYSLSITIGNTVGTLDDLKALLPTLLERLVTDTELDPEIVFGKLAGRNDWRGWPSTEYAAVDGYLRAVWRSLLTDYPSRLGAVSDATTFLDAAAPLYAGPDTFLTVWDGTNEPSADRHLAVLVLAWSAGWQHEPSVVAWLRRPATQERLLHAFERDHESPWADELARAYDMLAG